MNVNDLKIREDNPRRVSKKKLKELANDIEAFPKMMVLRPIIINSENEVLRGAQRLEALKMKGYDEIPEGWVRKVDDLTEDEQKEFMIKDNVHVGEWDMRSLNSPEWKDHDWQKKAQIGKKFDPDKNRNFIEWGRVKLELNDGQLMQLESLLEDHKSIMDTEVGFVEILLSKLTENAS